MSDLMELVNECEVTKAETAEASKINKASENLALLRDLGMRAAARTIDARLNPIIKRAEIAALGYIEITPEKIQRFLDRKAKEYDEAHAAIEAGGSVANFLYVNPMTTLRFHSPIFYYDLNHSSKIRYFNSRTMHFGGDGPIGCFEWSEVTTADYAGIPPADVLLRMKDAKEKNAFDYFTIASVNSVHDPLLLGRVEGSGSRFFIAQWGDDVCLDDVV